MVFFYCCFLILDWRETQTTRLYLTLYLVSSSAAPRWCLTVKLHTVTQPHTLLSLTHTHLDKERHSLGHMCIRKEQLANNVTIIFSPSHRLSLYWNMWAPSNVWVKTLYRARYNDWAMRRSNFIPVLHWLKRWLPGMDWEELCLHGSTSCRQRDPLAQDLNEPPLIWAELGWNTPLPLHTEVMFALQY